MAKLIVALDMPTAKQAIAMAEQLVPATPWMKVGLELYLAEGQLLLSSLRSLGCKVFLDLKLHDIPNTVERASQIVAGLGVSLFTVHACGGERMLAAAKKGAEEGARIAGVPVPTILAVTVLTSMAQEDLPPGVGAVPDYALYLAGLAHKAGIGGVVCSGQEVQSIKNAYGTDFIGLTPGIRPAGSESADQRRVLTPKQAVANGSDFLVVGRPIIQAQNPVQVAYQILQDMQ